MCCGSVEGAGGEGGGGLGGSGGAKFGVEGWEVGYSVR